MTDKMALVERLRNPAYNAPLSGHGPGAVLDQIIAIAVMREAADWVEYLERMAGAVTQGESLQEIRDKARGKS